MGAQRILGLGDVLTLVEKASETIKAEEAARAETLARRMLERKFDLNDFLEQYRLMSNMSNMTQLIKMLPGLAQVSEKQLAEAERKFKVFASLIQSMTPKERENPELLARSESRRQRIARGSGRTEM